MKKFLSFLLLFSAMNCFAAQQEEIQKYKVCIRGKEPFEIIVKKGVLEQLALVRTSETFFEDEGNSISLQEGYSEQGVRHLVEYLQCNSHGERINFLALCDVDQMDELMHGLKALGYEKREEFCVIIKDSLDAEDSLTDVDETDLDELNLFNVFLDNGFFRLNAPLVSTVLKEMQLAALVQEDIDYHDLVHPDNLGEFKVALLKANDLWFDLSIRDLLENPATRGRVVPQMIAGKLTLALENCFLTSVEGLEFIDHIDQVTHLKFAHNQITALEPNIFIHYSQIRSIDCAYNKLTCIKAGTFAHLPNLECLFLLYNQIAEIEPGGIYNLPRLKTLYCSENHLSSASLSVFRNFPSLKKLCVDGNRFTAVPSASFVGLESLEELNLHGNEITEIRTGSFAHLPQLKKLLLIKNHIVSLTATSFLSVPDLVSQLRKRELSHCLMKDSLISFPRLETLELHTNEIVSIDPSLFLVLPALNKIDLRGNRMSKENKELVLGHKPTQCFVWGL